MIEVLRLGHRRARDARLSTHVCLTARAFGAQRVVVAEKDSTLEKTIEDVTKRFGGPFEIRTGVAWKPYLREWKKRGRIVHLTMYGEAFEAVAKKVGGEDVLVVVGSEKVPPDIYDLADFNVAIGNQPHSEVAALAVFLDRLTSGAWQERSFDGGMRIVPTPRGKTIIGR